VHQQRPGDLADLQPPRRQQPLAVAPGAALVVSEPRGQRPAEAPRIAAVGLPRRQPRAQVVVALHRGPAHQLLGDLASRVDDERQVGACLDAVDPALAAVAVVDARRAERHPDAQRGHRVARLVPGGPDRRLPGGRQAGEAAVVALPGPLVVHDRLVVVADEPGQLGLDPGQDALLRRLHRHDGGEPTVSLGGLRGASRESRLIMVRDHLCWLISLRIRPERSQRGSDGPDLTLRAWFSVSGHAEVPGIGGIRDVWS